MNKKPQIKIPYLCERPTIGKTIEAKGDQVGKSLLCYRYRFHFGVMS